MGNNNDKLLAEASDNYIDAIENALGIGDAAFRQFKQNCEKLILDMENWFNDERERIRTEVQKDLEGKNHNEATRRCIDENNKKILQSLENLRLELKKCKEYNQYEIEQMQHSFQKFIKEGREQARIISNELNRCLEKSPEYKEDARVCIEAFTAKAASSAKNLGLELTNVTSRLNILYVEYEKCSNPALQRAKTQLSHLRQTIKNCQNIT